MIRSRRISLLGIGVSGRSASSNGIFDTIAILTITAGRQIAARMPSYLLGTAPRLTPRNTNDNRR
jgi:hypothetical protein